MSDVIEGDAVTAGLPPPLVLSTPDASVLAFSLQRGRIGSSAVQLVATHSGEGTSTIARDLSLVAALNGTETLLLAAEVPARRSDWARSIYGMPSGLTVISDGPPQLNLVRLGTTRMALAALSGSDTLSPAQWLAIITDLRRSFEFIVVDSPALERAFTSIMLAPHLDATAIVVAAESTRATAVRKLRDRLSEVGGETAGVVLNKRRFHVPRAAYERL